MLCRLKTDFLDGACYNETFVDLCPHVRHEQTDRRDATNHPQLCGRVLMPHFENHWTSNLENMQEFVSIDVPHIELITSPAYDVGLTREQLVETNLNRLKHFA